MIKRFITLEIRNYKGRVLVDNLFINRGRNFKKPIIDTCSEGKGVWMLYTAHKFYIKRAA
jgi:hypothetical protein